jgi:hypothetical protein
MPKSSRSKADMTNPTAYATNDIDYIVKQARSLFKTIVITEHNEQRNGQQGEQSETKPIHRKPQKPRFHRHQNWERKENRAARSAPQMPKKFQAGILIFVIF